MLHHPLAIALLILTIVYILTMILLYRKYRASTEQLSEELRRIATQKKQAEENPQEDPIFEKL